MSPETLNAMMISLQEELERLLAGLRPDQRAALEAEVRALLEAIRALRAAIAAGVANLGPLMRTVFVALDRLIDAMRAAGLAALVRGSEAFKSAWFLLDLYGTAGAEGAAGGTAGVVAVELLVVLALLIAAVLAWIKAVNEIVIAKGPVARPVGGMMCGGPLPVARGLRASGWSWWGQFRAFEDAQANARAAAQAIPCTPTPGATCTTGVCRGNCAILAVDYGWRFLFTRCTVTFDVYCECY